MSPCVSAAASCSYSPPAVMDDLISNAKKCAISRRISMAEPTGHFRHSMAMDGWRDGVGPYRSLHLRRRGCMNPAHAYSPTCIVHTHVTHSILKALQCPCIRRPRYPLLSTSPLPSHRCDISSVIRIAVFCQANGTWGWDCTAMDSA